LTENDIIVNIKKLIIRNIVTDLFSYGKNRLKNVFVRKYFRGKLPEQPVDLKVVIAAPGGCDLSLNSL